jgi:hypothetical protein
MGLLLDKNGNPTQIMELKSPHDVDGTSASAQSDAIEGDVVRIFAVSGTVRWLIGANPTALATSHALGEGQEIYQPIGRGQKVAILGGVANIGSSTL